MQRHGVLSLCRCAQAEGIGECLHADCNPFEMCTPVCMEQANRGERGPPHAGAMETLSSMQGLFARAKQYPLSSSPTREASAACSSKGAPADKPVVSSARCSGAFQQVAEFIQTRYPLLEVQSSTFPPPPLRVSGMLVQHSTLAKQPVAIACGQRMAAADGRAARATIL